MDKLERLGDGITRHITVCAFCGLRTDTFRRCGTSAQASNCDNKDCQLTTRTTSINPVTPDGVRRMADEKPGERL